MSHASVVTSDGSLKIVFANVGQAAAVFHLPPGAGSEVPRSYTVDPGRQLIDWWAVLVAGNTEFDYGVHGPNGFYCRFKGGIGGAGRALVDVAAINDGDDLNLKLALTGRDPRQLGRHARRQLLAARRARLKR